MRRSLRNPARAGFPKLFRFRRGLRASRRRTGDSAATNQRTQPRVAERDRGVGTPSERVEPPVTPTKSPTIAPPDVVELEAEERYHRERLALYRARSYSSRPTSPARLRELGRIWEAAKARLTAARSQRR